ncbi:MAG: hypothetical protein Ct9H90mP7_2750 [Candidatus Neomarinimicrobiota bacterium]|nr:MAG: hypothetical protein Ct9H90mP7_2750 [Candidatus Neomarinimicrobiota bacterium]
MTAKSFIDKGALVPDNVLLDLIDARLNKHDAQSGYILDGFPRTIAQAEGLNNLMSKKIASSRCSYKFNRGMRKNL